VRRRYDILMVWSIDRLGRRVLHVANALAELDAAGIRLYCDREGTPMGRAIIQMASVFGEQERSMLRARVLAGLDRVRQQGKKLGRPKVSPKIEHAIRHHLSAGKGILKVAAMVGVGSGTVQRVKREGLPETRAASPRYLFCEAKDHAHGTIPQKVSALPCYGGPASTRSGQQHSINISPVRPLLTDSPDGSG
jgi:DNA invertase Pin-like site-specific DNA recombinase